jgi:hypothetical protein
VSRAFRVKGLNALTRRGGKGGGGWGLPASNIQDPRSHGLSGLLATAYLVGSASRACARGHACARVCERAPPACVRARAPARTRAPARSWGHQRRPMPAVVSASFMDVCPLAAGIVQTPTQAMCPLSKGKRPERHGTVLPSPTVLQSLTGLGFSPDAVPSAEALGYFQRVPRPLHSGGNPMSIGRGEPYTFAQCPPISTIGCRRIVRRRVRSCWIVFSTTSRRDALRSIRRRRMRFWNCSTGAM